jgi:Cu+-exporting ATPase
MAIMSNIRQKLVFVFINSAAGVPVAAGMLYPFFSIPISPIFAAAVMSLSSIRIISDNLI